MRDLGSAAVLSTAMRHSLGEDPRDISSVCVIHDSLQLMLGELRLGPGAMSASSTGEIVHP